MIGNSLVSDWCERTIEAWLSALGAGARLTDLAFHHRVPFHLINVLRRKGVARVRMSSRYAPFFDIDEAHHVKVEDLSVKLDHWNRAGKEDRTHVFDLANASHSCAIVSKGAALQRMEPSYVRFSADIDLEFAEVTAAAAFGLLLLERGYKPFGRFRSATSPRSFLNFTLSRRVNDNAVFVGVSSDFIEACPSDYGALVSHPYIRASCNRVRSWNSAPGCAAFDATDWLIRMLLEMTSNHGLRLRDIIDFDVYLQRSADDIDWDRFLYDTTLLGLEPFWIATVEAWQSAGGEVLNNVAPFPQRIRRFRSMARSLGLALTARNSRLRQSLLAHARFIYKSNVPMSGRWGVGEVLIKTLARFAALA